MAGFNKDTDAFEVADFYKCEIKDKTSRPLPSLLMHLTDIDDKVIVTGVSPNGLGAATCEAIAPHGPRLLILTGRNTERPQAVAKSILARYADLNLHVVHMDLSSSKSVKQAATEIETLCATNTCCIDVLINNAGVMCIPNHTLTEEGLEMHLQVNYLGHFLLTRLLGDKLKTSPSRGRVVNVSSSAHAVSPFRFSNPNFIENQGVDLDEQPSREACDEFGVPWTLEYSPLIAYGQSKAAGILHAVALAQNSIGNGITACSVHPGGS
jgi:NAD(P)-dependent dehydrogenase (short-subunit alcohol dehydrogenase family)